MRGRGSAEPVGGRLRGDGAEAVLGALTRLTAVALAACAPPSLRDPSVRDKGLEPTRTTLAALAEVHPPRRLAVVVGVDHYGDPTFPALRHAADDARAIAEQLSSPQVGGFDEVRALIDPSREQVFEALRVLAATARRQDTLLVYVSGHGTRVADGRRFLLMRDSTSRDLSATAVEVEALQAWLSTTPAGRRALVLDACFDGDGKSVRGPTDAAPYAAAPAPALGDAHLFATSPGRPSREDDGLGHGVYTYFLLDAMAWSFADADVDRDGLLSAWEAHDHARGRTIEHTNGAQVPEASLHVVGEADVIVAGSPGQRREREQALVYLYPMGDHALSGANLIIDGRDKGALPGTVPLPPGRHHVVVRDAAGEVAVDGTMRFAAGRSYRADDVVRLAQGPSRMAGWHLVSASAPPLGEAIGAGIVGPELSWARRRNRGAGAGFTTWIHVGAGVAPERGRGDTAALAPRPAAWASVTSGYQADAGRFRGRVGLGVSPVWIPASYRDEPRVPGIDPYQVPREAGWLFVGAGPSAGLGYVLGGGWTAQTQLRPHLGAFDADGDQRLDAVPWLVASLGVEADF